jgi:hypothetical protein
MEEDIRVRREGRERARERAADLEAIAEGAKASAVKEFRRKAKVWHASREAEHKKAAEEETARLHEEYGVELKKKDAVLAKNKERERVLAKSRRDTEVMRVEEMQRTAARKSERLQEERRIELQRKSIADQEESDDIWAEAHQRRGDEEARLQGYTVVGKGQYE